MAEHASYLRNLKSESVVQRVINCLTDGMVSGELKPGDKLPPEPELASQLGVARTSVREATKILAYLGVLESRRAEGTFVSDGFKESMIDPMVYGIIMGRGDDFDSLMELRELIEVGIIRLAVKKETDEDLEGLRVKLCEFEDAASGKLGDPVRDAFLAALAGLPRGELCFDIGTDVRMNSVEAAPRVFREGAEEGPGRLAMGWRLGECMEEPDPAALRVFNAAYGGAPSGRLSGLPGGFSSCLDDVKGLLVALGSADGPDSAAGADAALKGLAAGSITGAEIDAAREYCAGALRRTQEDPERLLDYCLRMAVTGAELSPDELAELCGRVTPGSVADIAAGAELDAVYFLGGGETED